MNNFIILIPEILKQDAKVCPLQKYISNFLDLKGHSCAKKTVQKTKKKGEKIPHQKKKACVFTTVAVRFPTAGAKQSLLTKYYEDRFLDHEKTRVSE